MKMSCVFDGNDDWVQNPPRQRSDMEGVYADLDLLGILNHSIKAVTSGFQCGMTS